MKLLAFKEPQKNKYIAYYIVDGKVAVKIELGVKKGVVLTRDTLLDSLGLSHTTNFDSVEIYEGN